MAPTGGSPIVAGMEQILLLVFILMTLVGIAGGNPSSVLRPVCGLVAQVLTALLSLICSLLVTAMQILLPMLVIGLRNVIGAIESAYQKRRIGK